MFSAIDITVEVISPSDPPAAGERYSLMCTVTRPDTLNLATKYQWFKTTISRTQVGTNSPILTFDPLVLSDAGQYSCEVTVSSSLLSQDIIIVSQHYRLKFISKFAEALQCLTRKLVLSNTLPDITCVPSFVKFIRHQVSCWYDLTRNDPNCNLACITCH